MNIKKSFTLFLLLGVTAYCYNMFLNRLKNVLFSHEQEIEYFKKELSKITSSYEKISQSIERLRAIPYTNIKYLKSNIENIFQKTDLTINLIEQNKNLLKIVCKASEEETLLTLTHNLEKLAPFPICIEQISITKVKEPSYKYKLMLTIKVPDIKELKTKFKSSYSLLYRIKKPLATKNSLLKLQEVNFSLFKNHMNLKCIISNKNACKALIDDRWFDLTKPNKKFICTKIDNLFIIIQVQKLNKFFKLMLNNEVLIY